MTKGDIILVKHHPLHPNLIGLQGVVVRSGHKSCLVQIPEKKGVWWEFFENEIEVVQKEKTNGN